MAEDRISEAPTKLGATGAVGRAMEQARAARAARLAAGEDLETTRGEPNLCGICGGAGYVRRPGMGPLSAALAGYVSLGGRGHSVETQSEPCPRCRPVPSREEQLAAACLFPVKTFDGWNDGYAPEMARAVVACHELCLGDRATVFLRGGPGRGKTHLAKATAVCWIEGERGRALFMVAASMLDRMRETQADNARERLVALLDLWSTIPLLVLDDLGAERPTPWAQEQMFKLIDRRTSAGLALIVTSNVRPSEEDGRIEERVLSRLSPGEIVIVGGEDRRRTLGQA